MYYATHTPGPTRPHLKPQVFRFDGEELRDEWISENPAQRTMIEKPADSSGFHDVPMRINGKLHMVQAREWTAEDSERALTIDDHRKSLPSLGNTPGPYVVLNHIDLKVGKPDGTWVAIYGEGYMPREQKDANVRVGLVAPELLEIVRLLAWTDASPADLANEARALLAGAHLATETEIAFAKLLLARDHGKV